jgi:hypothetical protein
MYGLRTPAFILVTSNPGPQEAGSIKNPKIAEVNYAETCTQFDVEPAIHSTKNDRDNEQ